MELLNRLLVVAQILLAADEDDGQALAEVQDLRDPLQRVSGVDRLQPSAARYLLLDVVKRIGRVNGKADQDNVRVGVGERAQTVVVFLACGIPEGELDVLAIDLDVGDVVLEDGGYVHLRGHDVSTCATRSRWHSCGPWAAVQPG